MAKGAQEPGGGASGAAASGEPKPGCAEWWEQRQAALPGLRRDRAAKAAHALLAWLAQRKEESRNVLEDGDEFVHMLVTLKKVPTAKFRLSPTPIRLVHPLYMEKDVDVCLIVKDKDDKERKAFKELLVPGSVAKVLGAKKMLKKYESYEARRQLVKRYDLFLMDKRMVTVTTDYIGKEFTRRKKCPAFVDIAKKNPVNSIQRMRQSTFMYQWGGSSRSARVAWSSFSPSQIVDNIFMALYDFVRHLQGGWEDILSVFLKTQDSTSLPIYQSMPGMLGNLEVVQEGECAASSSDDIAEEFEDSKSKKAAEKVEMIGRGKRKNTQKEGHKKKAKGRTAKATLR